MAGSYLNPTCTKCDKGLHADCDGTAVYMDQDGPNRYVCTCHCRYQIREAQRVADAVSQVRRLMRHLNIEHVYELVERKPADV